MPVALVTGVFWGTRFTLTRSLDSFSAAEFLHIGKTIIANVAVPMRILMHASLLVTLGAIWLYPVKHVPEAPDGDAHAYVAEFTEDCEVLATSWCRGRSNCLAPGERNVRPPASHHWTAPR